MGVANAQPGTGIRTLQLPRESMVLSAGKEREFFQANSSKFDTLVVQNIGKLCQSVIEDEDLRSGPKTVQAYRPRA
jgi:hypothetical protein